MNVSYLIYSIYNLRVHTRMYIIPLHKKNNCINNILRHILSFNHYLLKNYLMIFFCPQMHHFSIDDIS